MAVTVRRAVGEDARDIAGVHVRGWQAAYRGLLPDHVLDGLSIDDELGGVRLDDAPRQIRLGLGLG